MFSFCLPVLSFGLLGCFIVNICMYQPFSNVIKLYVVWVLHYNIFCVRVCVLHQRFNVGECEGQAHNVFCVPVYPQNSMWNEGKKSPPGFEHSKTTNEGPSQ